jgi:pilus assembly protein CpaE
MADDHIDKGSWSGNGAEGNGHGSEGEGNRHGATPSPRPVGGKEPMTTLLILEDESTRSSTLSMMRGIAGVELVGERHELRSGLLLARQKGARLVVLDLPKDYEESLQAAAQFKQDSPDTALFLVGGSLDPQFLLKAIRAGASEVLKKPLDRAILQEAIERVSRSGAARSASGSRARSIITVFTTKGGVGSTTLSANLAVSLKAQYGVETVLADFETQAGGSAHVLGLKADRSINDLLRAPRLDSAALSMNLLRHQSGLAVLAQPEELTQAEPLSAAQAGEIVDVLSSAFDCVVLDCPHAFEEISLELLDRSTTILMVVELSIPSIRATRRALEVLEHLRFTEIQSRVQLVVNRYSGARGFITLDQLYEAVGMRASHTVHNDYRRVFASVNAGRAICLEDPDSPAAKDITAMAGRLIGRDTPATPVEDNLRRGFFGRKVLR